ncbi:nitroreductase family protein [Flexilinea flocculi]|uniref:Nitroreductase n=1 Tax=Flexilinea flocculi TaxID=1678840 RepID=A0A0S7BSJ3_9CHLR|nr:nitroreductase family protein [Flexilinea flocculi]GAP40132.1 nitroreductase [Flexilinea flocculi]
METLEAIRTRRSVRSYTSEPIDDADLQKIIEAAASAPSGGNSQSWLFISVCEPKQIARMRAICPGIIGIPSGIIVLCLDFRGQKKEVLPIIKYLDIGAAMQNILLAAHDLGLGGCAIGSFHVEGVKEFLKIPEQVEPVLLIVLGKPRSIPSAPRKKLLQEIYFQESFEKI